MTHRPVGVTLLAGLAALAAVLDLVNVLQYLGLLPFQLGPLELFHQDLLGAVLFATGAAINLVVAYGLWRLRAWAWLYAILVSGFVAIVSVLALLGASSWAAVAPALIVSLLVLVYCFVPRIRDAFET
jgi:uncharacterized membrane protein (DUF2068 family)